MRRHNKMVLFKVHREIVDGKQVSVNLEAISDTTHLELHTGEEVVTALLPIDIWEYSDGTS